jgi:hypothetical protein
MWEKPTVNKPLTVATTVFGSRRAQNLCGRRHQSTHSPPLSSLLRLRPVVRCILTHQRQEYEVLANAVGIAMKVEKR